MLYKCSSRLSSAAVFPIHLHTFLGRNAEYRATVSLSLDVCIQQGSRYSTKSYTSKLFLGFGDVVWCIICVIVFFTIISSECRPLTPPSHFNILTRALRQIDLVRAVLNGSSETPVGQP